MYIIAIGILTLSIFTGLNARAIVADSQNNRVTTAYTTTSSTFTNIPGLSFNLLPNTVYQFTVAIIWKGYYGEFAVGPLPSGSSFSVCGYQFQYNPGSYNLPNQTFGCVKSSAPSPYGPAISGAATATIDEQAFYTGAVVTGPSGGTFNIQGAVEYAGAPLTVEFNSWIQAQVSSA